MTGMSPAAQAYAEGAVTRTLKDIGSAKRPPLQAGLVLTDVHDGEVRAVVGSRVFSEPGFNRAVEAQRPVGSLLKPFVYLLALAQPGQRSQLPIGPGDEQRSGAFHRDTGPGRIVPEEPIAAGDEA